MAHRLNMACRLNLAHKLTGSGLQVGTYQLTGCSLWLPPWCSAWPSPIQGSPLYVSTCTKLPHGATLCALAAAWLLLSFPQLSALPSPAPDALFQAAGSMEKGGHHGDVCQALHTQQGLGGGKGGGKSEAGWLLPQLARLQLQLQLLATFHPLACSQVVAHCIRQVEWVEGSQ